jgi:hypothetical protein
LIFILLCGKILPSSGSKSSASAAIEQMTNQGECWGEMERGEETGVGVEGFKL